MDLGSRWRDAAWLTFLSNPPWKNKTPAPDAASTPSLPPFDYDTASAARTRLATVLPKFEHICVEGGEKLETLCVGSAQLATDCEALLQIASGRLDGENLARIVHDLLSEPLSYIDFCRDRHDELLRRLSACEGKISSRIAVRARMQATLAPLTYISVLFKIESAALSEEFRETFKTVTSEIERMRQLVDETFAKNAELLHTAHLTLSEVHGTLERNFHAQFTHIAKRRSDLEGAIHLLDRQLEQNDERDAQLNLQSTAINAQVAQIVQGLQFQDIVQQKCDHVRGAIATWDEKIPAQSAVRLQALQLEGVANDLSTGHDTIRNGLGQITGQLEQFEKSTGEIGTLEDMAAPDGMVKRLVDAIGEIHAMIHGLADVTEQTHEAIRPAGELANNLSSTLVELSTNMRLIALNAQIRSVQIGSLSGLETLASRTASISHEIDAVSEESSAALSGLRDDLDAMFATFGEFRERGQQQLTAMGGARASVESRLHTLRDRAAHSINAIPAAIAELHNCVDEFEASFAPLPDLRNEIVDTAQTLHDLAAQSPATDSADLSTDVLRYTMAAEHATHAALTGTSLNAAAHVAAELFGTPVTAPAAEAELLPEAVPTAESPPTAEADSKARQLPAAAAPAPVATPVPPTPAPAPDLGANVELF